MQAAIESLTHSINSLTINAKRERRAMKPMSQGRSAFQADSEAELHTATAHVYLEYDVRSPPPKPKAHGWTRFICFSDTHSSTVENVPCGDILIHAGDLSYYGKGLDVTVHWLKSLPHPNKLVIAGNHDDLLDIEMFKGNRMRVYADVKDMEASNRMLTGQQARHSNIRYLEYEARDIHTDGNVWRTFGSPGTPWYSAGAFQYEGRREAKRINDLIPHDTQILITHGPPRNILDATRRGKHAGCSALSRRLFSYPPSIPRGRQFNEEEMTWDFLERDDPRTATALLQAQPTTQSPGNLSTPRQHHRHTRSSPSKSTHDNDRELADWLPHVRLHVFGHIHEARGATIISRHPSPIAHARKGRSSKNSQQIDVAINASTEFEMEVDEPSNVFLPKPIETVFVNAAGKTHPIIVDLLRI
ncbi:Metallo-dependent phosphatase-like protein [Cantharellus anzutake]|uniref:Metallo-dependent phosphatase-like protein n=1 Tax=Cantharellus anzutake TaxID=1750568 RepID=UPI0019082738|nr:Metallo-dependent phosphatase-like protein [Cantharellus anzutake]KAF8344137.1 Metallo-dependent phosphatase-like protein [Cantharellus anzutake]